MRRTIAKSVEALRIGMKRKNEEAAKGKTK
jgi:hypothetical protein